MSMLFLPLLMPLSLFFLLDIFTISRFLSLLISPLHALSASPLHPGGQSDNLSCLFSACFQRVPLLFPFRTASLSPVFSSISPLGLAEGLWGPGGSAELSEKTYQATQTHRVKCTPLPGNAIGEQLLCRSVAVHTYCTQTGECTTLKSECISQEI